MSIIKRCAGLIAAMAVFAAASPVFAQANLKEEKVLIVVSSLDKKTKKKPTVEVFDKVGLSYDIASPKGGMPPFDGFDLKDRASLDFWTNPEHRNKLANSIPLAKVDPAKYSAILLVGGHGPMWDFVNNPELINIVRTMYEKNDIISAVCHGPAGLLNVKLSNGELLIKGRRLTGFTAEEEASRNYDKIVPFELEAALKKDGATFEEAPIFENKVVVDGRLITGQNPASAQALGEAVVKALQAK
ncbi:type 1 glutamine amidotransferase domain-containing protein [Pectobacterium polaris]|uniref:type 1 glutamine amidotransferase domain-containing protein n=1 Tax=Pectobacterium polaris TaxID=2042057 RepID=UPI0021C8AB9E|nr:type 1 glutamine amidotransferase domain-containing protein [Pectobacterium polaris]MCU1789667.1 type 1 glutamine amidotransferase domain-containing protein [Pectobacterium polaris]